VEEVEAEHKALKALKALKEIWAPEAFKVIQELV
jgi:hypothetical protein